jgi:hypothetical protein
MRQSAVISKIVADSVRLRTDRHGWCRQLGQLTTAARARRAPGGEAFDRRNVLVISVLVIATDAYAGVVALSLRHLLDAVTIA